MQDTAWLGLVHRDDPEGCCGEGGGREVHVWERMLELKIFRKMAMTTLYARQQKRHRCVYQTFGLRGRGRGRGWDDLGEWEF